MSQLQEANAGVGREYLRGSMTIVLPAAESLTHEGKIAGLPLISLLGRSTILLHLLSWYRCENERDLKGR
jgi:hypothetical protein